MKTWGALAELTIKAHYGGVQLPSDQEFTVRQVIAFLTTARDKLMDQELSKADRSDPPLPYDESWFTRYEEEPILWNDTRAMAYINLPQGYVDCKDQRGVRIMPTQGTENPFIPVRHGWMAGNKNLRYLEGNIAYSVAPATVNGTRRIEFPTMVRYDWEVVLLEVIERSGGAGTQDPIRMPASYEADCMTFALNWMRNGQEPEVINDDTDKKTR